MTTQPAQPYVIEICRHCKAENLLTEREFFDPEHRCLACGRVMWGESKRDDG